MSHRRLAAGGLAAAAVLLGACGGDDTLSRDELAARANRICRESGERIRAVRPPANITDPRQAHTYFDRLLPLARELLTRLRTLRPDDDARADYEAFLAAQEEGTELLVEIRDAAAAGDARRGESLIRQLDQASLRISATAGKARLEACRE